MAPESHESCHAEQAPAPITGRIGSSERTSATRGLRPLGWPFVDDVTRGPTKSGPMDIETYHLHVRYKIRLLTLVLCTSVRVAASVRVVVVVDGPVKGKARRRRPVSEGWQGEIGCKGRPACQRIAGAKNDCGL